MPISILLIAAVALVGAVVIGLFVAPAIYSLFETPSMEPVRLDHDSPAFQAVERAEQRLFERYDISGCRVHSVDVEPLHIRVRVWEVGAGPPVLMMPGGAGVAAEMIELINELPDYRVLAVNRPGGGGSDAIDHRAVGMRPLAIATLDAIFDHFALDRASLIGNSMGGLWSYWYALDQRKRVDRLVQLGTTAIVEGTGAVLPLRLLATPGLNRLLIKAVRPGSPADIREDAERLGHPPAVGQAWPQERLDYMFLVRQLPTFEVAMPTLAEEMIRPIGGPPFVADKMLYLEEMTHIEPPTLLLWGDHDPYGTLQAARRIEAALPNAELHQVGTGHLPWWDELSVAGRLIRGFLEHEGEG